jgi:Mg2+ and Co2+ transporter CorA
MADSYRLLSQTKAVIAMEKSLCSVYTVYMIQKYTYKRLTWIDLESPSSDEVAKVMSEYKLHPLVAEELLQKSLKPKVDFYNDYIFLILHIPVRTKDAVKDQEVDFVIGKEFIITTKYDTVEPLHNFSKMFEVNSILDKSGIGEHAGFIFFHMLKKLYKNMSHELNAFEVTRILRHNKPLPSKPQPCGPASRTLYQVLTLCVGWCACVALLPCFSAPVL